MSKARITGQTFERDPDFDLQKFAERSFGAFQEPPVDVELRFSPDAARDAATFLFHPSQTLVKNEDDSLTVQFRAGGLNEMCWHLITWGEGVTVEKPAELRESLRSMCAGWRSIMPARRNPIIAESLSAILGAMRNSG